MKRLLLVTFGLIMSSPALAIECHGTEPFWGALVNENKISLKSIAEDMKHFDVTKTYGAAGHTEEFIKIYADERGPLAVIKANKCDNGMSEDIFPKQIVLFSGSQTLYGCCGEPLPRR